MSFMTVAKCKGCSKQVALGNALNACLVFAQPWAKQRIAGGCPFNNNSSMSSGTTNKKRVGQQKQKKG